MAAKRIIYQFKIELLDTSPLIWRRIQVPEKYSFWDLHVAIQDAMGWWDYHLHAFQFGKSRFPKWEIGIPTDDDIGDTKVLPGWEVPVKDRFEVGTSCFYEYDFGDGWRHEVMLEGILVAEKGLRYPICLSGEVACPPEDCGGVHGYQRLLEILADPTDDEFDDLRAWVGPKFDPESFDPEDVSFDNPQKRWDNAFKRGI